jgi:radical SAM superfamily enzyme
MPEVFCQSCAMPLKSPTDFGTNIDGTKNREYCVYCFQRGTFSEPQITLAEMVTKCVTMMKQQKLPDSIIAQAKKIIPQLKRWKQD